MIDVNGNGFWGIGANKPSSLSEPSQGQEKPMATSKCPKCDSTCFEMRENAPSGSKYKLMFVQCAYCGAVVGVTDYFNIPSLLEKIARHLGFSVV